MILKTSIWIIIFCAVILISLFIGFKKSKINRTQGMTFFVWSAILIPIIFVVLFGVIANRGINNDETEETDTDSVEETETADEYNMFEVVGSFNGLDSVSEYNSISGVSCEASSSLNSEKYGGDKLLDGNEDTCWQDGIADSYGIGEYLDFNFDENTDIKYLAILNGRVISPEKYEQNARPQILKITDPETDRTVDIYLEDIYNEYQVFELSGFENINNLVFSVQSVYDGSEYTDTVITEITFFN